MAERYKDGVFLSGLWRSGSTFIWSRFRDAPGTYCFYEPLNQGLGRLNKKRIARYNPEVTKLNTHPVLEKPYFAEFEPLMKWRGVKNFKRRFAYDHYAMEDGEKDAALKKYIQGLCDLGKNENLLPVLGFNQTNFRTHWLRNNFDALHIHIERSPREIWNSYKRIADNNNYTYFLIWLTIIERNKDHPLFTPLAEKFQLRNSIEKIVMKPKAFYRQALKNITDEETYFMVFYLWIASALHALSFSDHIIDINRAGENSYAASAAQKIKAAVALDVDLSGLRAETPHGEEPINFSAIEADALQYFPVDKLESLFDKTRAKERFAELNAEKAALLARLL